MRLYSGPNREGFRALVTLGWRVQGLGHTKVEGDRHSAWFQRTPADSDSLKVPLGGIVVVFDGPGCLGTLYVAEAGL